MQILNLINKEKSNINYSISRFPVGEVQITLGEFSHKDEIIVFCRITNAEELFILMQVGDILKRHGVCFVFHIYYLMSMRMDRVMDFNRPFSLSVVCNVLDSLGARHIAVYCPHSLEIKRLIKNSDVLELPSVLKTDYKKYQSLSSDKLSYIILSISLTAALLSALPCCQDPSCEIVVDIDRQPYEQPPVVQAQHAVIILPQDIPPEHL